MSHPEIIRQLLAHASPAVQPAPDIWTVDYRLPRDFPGFTGHFPGNPVLPALLQVVMVRLLIEEALGVPCSLEVRNAKFSVPIRPDALITVSVERGTPSWKAVLRIRQDGSDGTEAAATLSVIPAMLEDKRRDS